MPDARVPKTIGTGEDRRNLGIAFHRLRLLKNH